MQPLNARGTRDLLPATLLRRMDVIERIRSVFVRYGFEPLETPAMERLDTLLGKYGEEGDKLLFRILERGEGGREGKADLGLRYDLTVPLARVVAQNPALPLPFKRYQIQPVWRADRPQKGRFREFYQCDVDTVGSRAPLADAECVAVWSDALTTLGFSDFVIHVNHRQLLLALVQAAGCADQESAVLVAVDKLDKIGLDGVAEELRARQIPSEAVDQLVAGLAMAADLDGMERFCGERAAGPAAELREVLALTSSLGAKGVVFDGSLARGMSYYTGPVFEARIIGGGVGSVGGGGRYDKLIGLYGGRDLPATGSSLGLERIITVMEERGMLSAPPTSTVALVTLFSAELVLDSVALAARLRAAGIPVETWLGEPGGLGKQLKFAAGRGVPYALVLGPGEQSAGVLMVRDLRTGTQQTMLEADALNVLRGCMG